MTQLVTRVPAEMAEAVDALVAMGRFASRSDVVREALAMLIERHVRAETAEKIVEGYRRRPQAIEQVGWSDEATRRMIAEEPW